MFNLGTPVTLVVEGLSTRHTVTAVGVLCEHCDLPIRETHMGRVRNEWEHMNGLSFCADGKNWAWPAAPPVPMDLAIDALVNEVRKPGCCYASETLRQLRPLLEELVLRRAGCAVDGTAYITESK